MGASSDPTVRGRGREAPAYSMENREVELGSISFAHFHA
jgi:hypothetical protein